MVIFHFKHFPFNNLQNRIFNERLNFSRRGKRQNTVKKQKTLIPVIDTNTSIEARFGQGINFLHSRLKI